MPYRSGISSVLPTFTIGGSGIENVDRWPHIISTNLNNQADILYRRNCFIGQVNNVLCTFSKLDSFIMNRLFKVYRARARQIYKNISVLILFPVTINLLLSCLVVV